MLMSPNSEATASVSVEASIHAAVKNFAQQMHDEFGVQIMSAHVDWLEISRADKRMALVTGVRLDAQTSDR